ncbi:UDP-N-acetylmuramoyl-tripeptide--D-alanyl-D-alanine ligase [Patescibacteria group bacterium]|nr:UDP-N-acetylmuramoyl-tripeptide--D-alanyl-D-alanine ligase [Patescibacteria group bacterium]
MFFRKIFQQFLSFFARRVVKRYKPLVIGVTGSVGKSSTKEAIALALQDKFNLRCSFQSYNNEIGLPLTILGVDSPRKNIFKWLQLFFVIFKLLVFKIKYPQVLVLEMAADHPGDITYLTNIAPPQIGVLTAIDLAHTEFFKNIKAVAKEKFNIIKKLKDQDWAILNVDDPRVEQLKDRTSGKVLTFGLSPAADLQAIDVRIDQSLNSEGVPLLKGLLLKVKYKGNLVPLFLPRLINEAQIYSVLAGIAVGLSLGFNLIELTKSFSDYQVLPGRLQVIEGIKKSIILDDTYNSSPRAVQVALATLSKVEISSQSRKWVVLGDMLELGDLSKRAHQEIGEQVVKTNCDFLITVGSLSREILNRARELSFPIEKSFAFSNSLEAGRFLKKNIKKGDLILMKASQGIRLERAVKQIMSKPQKASQFLVRQSSSWK